MKTILLLLSIGSAFIAYGQDSQQFALVSSGNSSTQSTTSLDWTVGQTISTTGANTQAILTSGIHQPLLITEVINILTVKHPEIQIYPNPVVETLSIQVEGTDELLIKLHDLEGREVISANAVNTLNLKELSNGVYILTLSSGTFISKHKIVKH
ncbi:MAG: T9SS type A sorting domain-containing protein [Marinoscillum sp.]